MKIVLTLKITFIVLVEQVDVEKLESQFHTSWKVTLNQSLPKV